MAAVLSHTLGPHLWRECLAPQPPWHEPRRMLEALDHAGGSLGLSAAEEKDFAGACKALCRAAGDLQRHRGRDEEPRFVRKVLADCRRLLATGRQCLAAKSAGAASNVVV